MTAGLKRYYGKGDLHFITFSCYQQLPLLKSGQARDIFVEELGKVRNRLSFRLIGYVVMPEHVHLLVSEPPSGTPSTVMHDLKLRVARRLRRPNEGEGERSRAFWQPRFYDFNVYRGEKLREKLGYMHANPVTRELVEHPGDWVWSSWSFYEKGEQGLISIDVVES